MAVKKSVEIAINPPNFQMVELEVEGLTPMIQNKMKEATIPAMEAARMGKAKKNNRAPIDPKVEYLKSAYVQDGGGYGFPASAFKHCAVRAGKGQGLVMTDLKQMFFVLPNAPDGECVSLKAKKPTLRKDPVNVQGNKDLRYRPEFKQWKAKLLIRYDADKITPEQIANLLNHGGQTIGVGEWRPQKNGTFGMFHVANGGS